MTKERLKAYRDLKIERNTIRGIIKEIDRDIQSPKVSSPGKLSGGGNKRGVSQIDVKIDDKNKQLALYRELDRNLDTELLEIEKAIRSAPLQSRERTILRLYYIRALKWEEVCHKMSYSLTHIHRIHASALEKLSEE